jgi:hypothetical protein
MLNVGQAVDGLAPADRASVLADAAAALDPVMLATFAATVPAPWPAPLADAVLGIARFVGQEQFAGPGLYELVRAAALRLAPGSEEELTAVASYRDEVRPALIDAVEIIRLRARIREAFAAVSRPA